MVEEIREARVNEDRADIAKKTIQKIQKEMQFMDNITLQTAVSEKDNNAVTMMDFIEKRTFLELVDWKFRNSPSYSDFSFF